LRENFTTAQAACALVRRKTILVCTCGVDRNRRIRSFCKNRAHGADLALNLPQIAPSMEVGETFFRGCLRRGWKSNAIALSVLVLSAMPSVSLSQALPLLSPENDPYCTVKPEELKFMSPGTRKMASLLEKLAREINPARSVFMNGERAAHFQREVAAATNDFKRAESRTELALELLNAGRTGEALKEFDAVHQYAWAHPDVFGGRFLASLAHYRAVGHLRLGEQENCLTNHSPDSCILPIRGGGIHKLQAGSRQAIAILEEQLRRIPRDRTGAWLLNLARMTVGEYPDGVPPSWRIPPEVFKSDFELKRFPDVAANLGLDVGDHAGGTISEDFDGDGDLDLLLSDWSPRGPMHYFVNNGDGTFSDQTVTAGLAGLVGGLHIVQGDYNNDRLPDVLIFRGGWQFSEGRTPDSLLRNDGKNHFTDVTEEAGLLQFRPNQTGVWFDYNSDGWLDLYFGYESSGSDEVHPCTLYRNNRNGTFTECARESGVANIGFVKGVTSADFNNDGRPDLYLSRRGQPNTLYRNDGPADPAAGKNSRWKFTDVSVSAGVTEPIASFPTWFFDYDNDGWEDIFVSGYAIQSVGDVLADYMGAKTEAERARLYRNNRDGTFSDVTAPAKLFKVLHTMGSNYGDFDNDGWLDLYLGTGDPDLANLMPNRAFRNADGQLFQDVTTATGLGHLQKGHGVSFADLDHDGDQDIYHSLGGAYQGDFYANALFENPGETNQWVVLKLEGTDSNAVGIGARIKVVLAGASGERVIYRTASTGGSFGANPLRQQIGLGQASSIQRLEITWPVTGKTQTFTNVAANRFYLVKESSPELRALDYKPFRFSTAKAAASHQHHP
jgi:hypothetical protein